MEPLSPAVRAALKQAHPGLDDATIDRLEELTVARTRFEPSVEAEAIRSIDAEIEQLLRERMPHFRQVVQSVAASEAAARHSAVAADRAAKVTVTIKRRE